jgi:hypothetical protein
MFDLLQVLCLIGVFVGAWRLGKFLEQLSDTIIELETRLTKLEKDAVKITFTDPPNKTDDVIKNK